MGTKPSKISKVGENDNPIFIFGNLKSVYILKRIVNNLLKGKWLEIIKYNKTTQKRLNLNIDDYIDFCHKFTHIEVEITPMKNKFGKFINMAQEEEKYFHIYFNDDNYEKKRNEIKHFDKTTKIKIIIDPQIKSFKYLFYNCKCIESINFKKFNRTDITNMCFMFYNCTNLKKINLTNFKTDNVNNMRGMFFGCLNLEQINVSKFKTDNVNNISWMFSGCSSLEKLNLSNFNTINVTDMRDIFSECSSLKKIDLSNFNTSNTMSMSFMFCGCSAIKKIDLSNFNTINVISMESMFENCYNLIDLNIPNFNNNNININHMFLNCSIDLLYKMKNQFKSIKRETFN